METKRFSSKQRLSILSLFFLAISVFIYGCGNESPPAETQFENNVTKLARFWQVDTKDEFNEEIIVKPEDGFYAVIELQALKDRPAIINKMEVADPENWPCVAVCYPKGSTSDDKDVVKFEVGNLYDIKVGESPPPILASAGPHMTLPKFRGPLKLKKEMKSPSSKGSPIISFQPGLGLKDIMDMQVPVLDHKFEDGIVPYWTFLGPTHKEPGEYTLEIHVYPFYTGNPLDKSSLGPAVVVYKGTLQIVK